MKGDFSRSTHTPAKHYSSVLLQQGRVLVDADWNEQRDIDLGAERRLTVDLLGRAAGPLGDVGYGVVVANVDRDGDGSAETQTLVLQHGRYYVDGILCELPADTPIFAQPDRPGVDALLGLAQGRYLVYLDVWERHVTPIEDPSIQEKALGGPDHCTRRQVVAQARLLDLAAAELGAAECDIIHDPAALATLIEGATRGAMTASVDPAPADVDPCIVPAEAGFRGLENQLYRVEIHRGGSDGSVTFKWSRDNGSVVTAWTGHPDPAGEPALIEVANLGPDGARTFNQANVLVELHDDSQELAPGPGLLARVESADEAVRTLRLKDVMDPDGGALPLAAIVRGADAYHPRVRRWEGTGVRRIDAFDVDDGTLQWIELEAGVRIRFEHGAGQFYRSGDYWLIPARTVDGTIEWQPEGAQAPHGVAHHYACLAIATLDAAGWDVESTCQEVFPSADRLTGMRYVGGDGQQAVLTDPGHALPADLCVQVLNGGVPVEGALVSFRIEAPVGDGSLLDLVGGATGPAIDATTDPNGEARVRWTLASESAWDANHALVDQRVRAVLLDECEDETTHVVVFSVHEPQAGEVRYDNTVAAPMAALAAAGFETDDVQAALDVLCANPALDYVSGDGQEAMPGDALANDLVVRVGNGAFGVTGMHVRFTLVDLRTLGTATAESWAGSLDAVQAGSVVNANWPSTRHRRVTVAPDANGYARVRWRLGVTPGVERPGVVARLIHSAVPIPFTAFDPGAEVRFQGRFSLASAVHYTPACEHLEEAGVATVQAALDALCTDRTLYYVVGTGQPVELGQTLPVALTVRVANEGTPVGAAFVRFEIVNLAASGSVDEATGGTLDRLGPRVVSFTPWTSGGTRSVVVKSAPDGLARATWTYGAARGNGVPGVRAVLLDASLAATTSRVEFEAVLERPAVPKDDGIHIVRTTMIARGGRERALRNDSTVDPAHLLDGIHIHCDRAPSLLSLRGKRTTYVSLEVPYGWDPRVKHAADDEYFAPVGVQHHDIHILDGTVDVDGDVIRWVPSTAARRMLVSTEPGPFASRNPPATIVLALGNPADWPLPLRLYLFGGGATRVRANLFVEGDFVVAKDDLKLHVDGETLGEPTRTSARIDLQFPSGDGRRGGDFRSWFWLEGRAWRKVTPKATGPRAAFPKDVVFGVTPLGAPDGDKKSDMVFAWSDEGRVRTRYYDSGGDTWSDTAKSYGEGVTDDLPAMWLRTSAGGEPDGFTLAYRARGGAPSVVRVRASGEEQLTELTTVLGSPAVAAASAPRGADFGDGEAVVWTSPSGSLVAALHEDGGSWSAALLDDEIGASSLGALLDVLDLVHARPGGSRPSAESLVSAALAPADIRSIERSVAEGRSGAALHAFALRIARRNGFDSDETEKLRGVVAELAGASGSALTREERRAKLEGAAAKPKLGFVGQPAVLADPGGALHVFAVDTRAPHRALYWFTRDARRKAWTGRDLSADLARWQAPQGDHFAAASGSDRAGVPVRVVAWLTTDGELYALRKIGDGEWTLEAVDAGTELQRDRPVAAAVDNEGVVHVFVGGKDTNGLLDVWSDDRTPWTVTDLGARAGLDGAMSGVSAARNAAGTDLVVVARVAAREGATLHTAWFGVPPFKDAELLAKWR